MGRLLFLAIGTVALMPMAAFADGPRSQAPTSARSQQPCTESAGQTTARASAAARLLPRQAPKRMPRRFILM